jgi:GT2 family glycosyltransferase
VTDVAAVTAIVTAYSRVNQTLKTLRRIKACAPVPDEILIHVDANGKACAGAVKSVFPDLRVLLSTDAVGPGGGRNKLIAAARNEFVASFDDDSYPGDVDFFARVEFLMRRFPEAAVITGAISHRGEPIVSDQPIIARTSSFVNCGTVFRRSVFLETGGFVPLVIAYGMEEEDLSLRLFDSGSVQFYSPWLRIHHDTNFEHHKTPEVTAGVIANLALLAWLRYPKRYWPYGVLQVVNRVMWSGRAGRTNGIVRGLAMIPRHLWRYRKYRRPVSMRTMSAKFISRKSGQQIVDVRSFALARSGTINAAEAPNPGPQTS